MPVVIHPPPSLRSHSTAFSSTTLPRRSCRQYDPHRQLREQGIVDAVSTGLSKREAEGLKDHHLGVQIGDHSS